MRVSRDGHIEHMQVAKLVVLTLHTHTHEKLTNSFWLDFCRLNFFAPPSHKLTDENSAEDDTKA